MMNAIDWFLQMRMASSVFEILLGCTMAATVWMMMPVSLEWLSEERASPWLLKLTRVMGMLLPQRIVSLLLVVLGPIIVISGIVSLASFLVFGWEVMWKLLAEGGWGTSVTLYRLLDPDATWLRIRAWNGIAMATYSLLTVGEVLLKMFRRSFDALHARTARTDRDIRERVEKLAQQLRDALPRRGAVEERKMISEIVDTSILFLLEKREHLRVDIELAGNDFSRNTLDKLCEEYDDVEAQIDEVIAMLQHATLWARLVRYDQDTHERLRGALQKIMEEAEEVRIADSVIGLEPGGLSVVESARGMLSEANDNVVPLPPPRERQKN